MPIKASTLYLALLLLTGCAGEPALPEPGAQHPASPDAAAAPLPPISPTLALNSTAAPAATKPSTAGAVTYTCPHHPEVTSDKPGQVCPKCNMKLVAKESSEGNAGHEGHR
jgi:hypothetical protein